MLATPLALAEVITEDQAVGIEVVSGERVTIAGATIGCESDLFGGCESIEVDLSSGDPNQPTRIDFFGGVLLEGAMRVDGSNAADNLIVFNEVPRSTSAPDVLVSVDPATNATFYLPEAVGLARLVSVNAACRVETFQSDFVTDEILSGFDCLPLPVPEPPVISSSVEITSASFSATYCSSFCWNLTIDTGDTVNAYKVFQSSSAVIDGKALDGGRLLGITTLAAEQGGLVFEQFSTEPTITVRNAGSDGGATFRMRDEASGADFKFKATGKAGFKVRDQANGQDVITIDSQTSTLGRKAMYVDSTGKVGIGTETGQLLDAELTVNGAVQADDLILPSGSLENWPDYVFDDNYVLRSLEQVERFIQQRGHLPGVPSESEVAANGVAAGQMIALQLEKIEELTLYLIELQKQNQALQERVSVLEQRP